MMSGRIRSGVCGRLRLKNTVDLGVKEAPTPDRVFLMRNV